MCYEHNSCIVHGARGRSLSIVIATEAGVIITTVKIIEESLKYGEITLPGCGTTADHFEPADDCGHSTARLPESEIFLY